MLETCWFAFLVEAVYNLFVCGLRMRAAFILKNDYLQTQAVAFVKVIFMPRKKKGKKKPAKGQEKKLVAATKKTKK
jgi:hypothetical protein